MGGGGGGALGRRDVTGREAPGYVGGGGSGAGSIVTGREAPGYDRGNLKAQIQGIPGVIFFQKNSLISWSMLRRPSGPQWISKLQKCNQRRK